MLLLEGVPSKIIQSCMSQDQETLYAPLQFNIPLASVLLVASVNTILYVGHGEGVHEVTLTLLGLVTISSWATENRYKVDLL